MFKKFLGSCFIMILSPALVFGALELGFRQFGRRNIDTYFDSQTQLELGYPVPCKQPNEYRIFIFGGSSAYGFPVADRYSIAAWLRKSFPHLLPDKKVKVINAAWPGKASHHILEGVRGVLKYEPDLYIIYSGHNEAPADNRLLAEKWPYRMDLILRYRSAFYRYLSLRLDRLRKLMVYGHSGYAEKQYREEAIGLKVYKNSPIGFREYNRILESYGKNTREMIRFAKKHGIGMLLTTAPSNLQDIPPGFSLHKDGLLPGDLAEWEKFFNDGKKFEKEGNPDAALEKYRKAADIDPDYAELQYRLGQVLLKKKDYENARKAFILARDCDGYPHRAKSGLNENIRRDAQDFGILLADIEKNFESLSPHGIIGSDLIYDNVHPSVSSQQVITDQILRVMAENDLVAAKEKWDWKALEAARENLQSEEWKVDGAVNAYRYILRGLNLWEKSRYEDALPDLEKGLELMPGFIEDYAFIADAYLRLGNHEKALHAFETLRQKDTSLMNLLRHKYPEIEESFRKVFPAGATSLASKSS